MGKFGEELIESMQQAAAHAGGQYRGACDYIEYLDVKAMESIVYVATRFAHV